MKHSLAAILGLSLALSQPVTTEQRPIARLSATETDKSKQVDVEFQRLFDDVKSLEGTIEGDWSKEITRTFYYSNCHLGKDKDIFPSHVFETRRFTPGMIIADMKRDDLVNLASRYSISVSEQFPVLFSFDKYLVLDDGSKAIMFSPLSVVVREYVLEDCDRLWVGSPMLKKRNYVRLDANLNSFGKYEIHKSAENERNFPLFLDGLDYNSLFNIVKELQKNLDYYRRELSVDDRVKYYRPSPDLEVAKYQFSSDLAEDLTGFLMNYITDDFLQTFSEKVTYFSNNLRVGGRNIVVFSNIIADRDKTMTLSFSPDGHVNYFLKADCCSEDDMKPIYKEYNIDFPIKK